MLDWYARFHRLLPHLRFATASMRSTGAPWNTTVILEWRASETHAGVDTPCGNGMTVIRLRWGRMVQLVICPYGDTLSAPLERLLRAGVAEAGAAPLT